MFLNSLKQLERPYKVKMKRMIKIGVGLIIVSMVIFFGIKIEKYFHKNYISADIFDSVDYIYLYHSLIRERRGEYEEKVVYTKDGFPVWLVDCGNIRVLYNYDEDQRKVLGFMYAQTTDSSYLFGEKGIQVGMDRDAVEKILRNSKKPSPDPHPALIIDDMGETSYQDVFAYYDDDYDLGMGFIYDDNNKVSHILLFFGL